MTSYQVGAARTPPVDRLPGAVLSLQASAWFRSSQDFKAGALFAASHIARGKAVEALVDTSSQNRVVVGVVDDILHHNPHLHVEFRLYPNQPKLIRSLVFNQPNLGYHTPSSGGSVMPTPPKGRFPHTAQNLAMVPSDVVKYNSPIIPQSAQRGTKRSISAFHEDALDTRHGTANPSPSNTNGSVSNYGDLLTPKENATVATRSNQQDGIVAAAAFLSDQWKERLPRIQKEFFQNKDKEERALHKKTYPWYVLLRLKGTKRPSIEALKLPGYLNLKDLAMEYYDFLRKYRLNIIHPVPENHPMRLDQYNFPDLYGSILCEAGSKSGSATPGEPQRAQKTSQNELPAMTQRSSQTSALPRQTARRSLEEITMAESPFINEQTSLSEVAFLDEQLSSEELSINENPIVNKQLVVNEQPIINDELIMSNQPARDEQSFHREKQGQPVFSQVPRTNEQPIDGRQPILDTSPVTYQQSAVLKQSTTDGQRAKGIAFSNPGANSNGMPSFWDHFRGQQQLQPRGVGAGGSTDGFAPPPAGVEMAPTEHQPATEPRPLAEPQSSYPGGNDGFDQTEPFWNQPLAGQGTGGFRFDGPYASGDILPGLDLEALFGEDPTSQQ